MLGHAQKRHASPSPTFDGALEPKSNTKIRYRMPLPTPKIVGATKNPSCVRNAG